MAGRAKGHRMRGRLTGMLLWAAGLAAVAAPAAADRWRSGEPMEGSRSFFSVASLGREIFVAGGSGLLGALNAFEAYDPQADFWRPLKPLPEARTHFGMSAHGGRIYVTGGLVGEEDPKPSSGLRIYDASNGRWSLGPRMPEPRSGHALAAAGGKLFVIGGEGPDAAAVFVLDPVSQTWSKRAQPLPEPRSQMGTAVLGDKVYVIGGLTQSGATTARVDILNAKTGAWSRGPNLPKARAGLTAAAVGNEIHIAGGSSVKPRQTYAEHMSLDAGAKSWRKRAPLLTPRQGLASAEWQGRWYVFGGTSGGGIFSLFTESNVVEIYEP